MIRLISKTEAPGGSEWHTYDIRDKELENEIALSGGEIVGMELRPDEEEQEDE